MTICPVYEGSVKISWYPVIAVLKTTSPDRSAGAPKLLPSKTVPSSRARIAESNNFLLGIGVKTIVRYRSPHPRYALAMGTKAAISVEEYLHTSFPDLDRE